MRSLSMVRAMGPVALLAIGLVAGGVACGTSEVSRPVAAPEQERAQLSLAETIEKLAAPLVEDGWLVGLTVGWVADGERGVIGLGSTALAEGVTPDKDTLYEIGSITKAFTAIALAAMVKRGEVALDTPVDGLLDDVDVPDFEGHSITLEHLATHTSGLPRLPDNLVPASADDPFAGYGREELAGFFASYELEAAPGARYEYSNLGAGLLGEALAAHAGMSYEALIRELVLEPLRMQDTTVRLSEDQARRLADAHAEGDQVPAWTFDALAGAGGLRATTDDLLTFIEANFLADHEVTGALAAVRQGRLEIPGGDWIGLGWHLGLQARGGPPGVVWHNGGTGGFHSFLVFDPEREVGVVVLTNSMQPTIERLGVAVLRLLRDEPVSFDLPRLIALEPEVLDRYVGVYELAPGLALTVLREGDRLLAQVTGQPQLPIFPSSETAFAYRVVEARIEFQLDAEGEVDGLILYQAGEAHEAHKTDEEPPARLEVVEVEIDGAILDRYEGEFELAPEVTIKVERKDGGLVAQVTGQPWLRIVPISETEFVYRDVDAQIEFVIGDGGEVEGLLLRQAGAEHDAPKID